MKHNYTARDFDYSLPDALIAKYPLEARAASRMLVVDRDVGQVAHRHFIDLLSYLTPLDLVVFNDTKVIPARLYGQKETGGKLECLVERVLSHNTALAHLKASKTPKVGATLVFANDHSALVLDRKNDLFVLEFTGGDSVLAILDQIGQIPIPPYLDRNSALLDKERYQTVFAAKKGAVAAPTAALHFDQAMFDALATRGIETAMITLHVGSGTFLPLRTNSLEDHVMHKEYLEVSSKVCEQIQKTRARGGRILAIGTTVVRSLEAAAQTGVLKPFQGETQLFITPGYEYKVVDVLFTNFHLPKSTLLMLVCAFGGYELIMKSYHLAVDHAYRFFSYGDAMLIL